MDYKDKIIEQRMEKKQERINRAIANKEKSIAYFNSVNSAISLLGGKANKKSIIKWRDWFYKIWQEWYLENMEIEPPKLTYQEKGLIKQMQTEEKLEQERDIRIHLPDAQDEEANAEADVASQEGEEELTEEEFKE